MPKYKNPRKFKTITIRLFEDQADIIDTLKKTGFDISAVIRMLFNYFFMEVGYFDKTNPLYNNEEFKMFMDYLRTRFKKEEENIVT